MNRIGKVVIGIVAIGVPAIAIAVHADYVQAMVSWPHLLQNANTNGNHLRDTVPVASNTGDEDATDPAQAAPSPCTPSDGGCWKPMGHRHPMPHGFMPPPMPPMLTRGACENRLNGEAGMVGFLKSKLRLTTDQRPAWTKIEDAAEPALEKLHAVCDRLPADGSAAPSLPDTLDVVEAQTQARLELIHATREPIRALYAMLTPDQRAALQPPVPPMPRP